MTLINIFFKKLLELLFFPWQNFPPYVALIFISLVTGLLLLTVYKGFSNQRAIKMAKNRIKAHLLELRLFSDDFLVSLKAQGQLLVWNFKYLLQALRPLSVMIIPLVFLLSHLNLWFAWEPLKPGDRTIVKIKLKEKIDPLQVKVILESTEGYEVETPPLRIASQGEINWRLRALKSGQYEIPIIFNQQRITKEIVIGHYSLKRLSSIKPASGFFPELLAPGEKPLSNPAIKEIVLSYPPRRFNFLGLKIHWLVAYFILSLATGFIFKKPFKIEI